MDKNVTLSTLMTYDVNKYKPLGIVRGINVHGVSLFRNIVSNLSSLFGGKNDAINKKVDDVYNEAIDELIKNALIMYPEVTMSSGVEVTLSVPTKHSTSSSSSSVSLPRKVQTRKNIR